MDSLAQEHRAPPCNGRQSRLRSRTDGEMVLELQAVDPQELSQTRPTMKVRRACEGCWWWREVEEGEEERLAEHGDPATGEASACSCPQPSSLLACNENLDNVMDMRGYEGHIKQRL